MKNPLASLKDGARAIGGRVAQWRAAPEAKATGGAIWGVLQGVKPAIGFAIAAGLILGLAAAGWVAIGVLGASSARHAYQNARPSLDRRREEARIAHTLAEQEVPIAENVAPARPAQEAEPRPEPLAQPPGTHASAELARRQGARGARVPAYAG